MQGPATDREPALCRPAARDALSSGGLSTWRPSQHSRRPRAALSHTYLLAIIDNRFCSDERIHLLLNFLLQISTCPIEDKEASSLGHEIITRNGDGFFD